MQRFYATQPEMNMPFEGAKLALFMGADLAVLLRDDKPDIPFPNHWDLPGGGREQGETPFTCVQRETREELGVIVPQSTVCWARSFVSEQGRTWFFVAKLGADTANDIRMGDEGQKWALMSPEQFLECPNAIPHFQARLRLYLSGGGRSEKPPAAFSGGR